MTILRVGNCYINLANVSEIIESQYEPGKVFVHYNFTTTGGENDTDVAASMFTGKEAAALILWLKAHSENVESAW